MEGAYLNPNTGQPKTDLGLLIHANPNYKLHSPATSTEAEVTISMLEVSGPASSTLDTNSDAEIKAQLFKAIDATYSGYFSDNSGDWTTKYLISEIQHLPRTITLNGRTYHVL